MRIFLFSGLFLLAVTSVSRAQAPAPAAPPFEVVSDDVDMEVNANGEVWRSESTTLRPLTEAGLETVRQRSLSYTQGYEELRLLALYTTKKDGTRITVPPDKILTGRGQASGAGFDGAVSTTIIFPNVEIGDTVTLQTLTHQVVPWFAKVVASTEDFSPMVPVGKAHIAFTAPSNMALTVDVKGMEEVPAQTLNGKTRRSWNFSNPVPTKWEAGAIREPDSDPHIAISTLPDYSNVANLYADIFRDKTEVTPDIQSLADKLTAGISDRKGQTRALYEWVAEHIRYVNIVLGAGGFTPHKASDILKNAFGDCKDHVMLLEALLKAKGIQSSPVLISAEGANVLLPSTPSPFLFDHLITYVPEFELYLDSTAQYAPFGVLPFMDSGKSVVLVNEGKMGKTPVSRDSDIAVDTVLTVNADGSASGKTKITARGAMAEALRGQIAASLPDEDDNFFATLFGPGSSGTFDRGQPSDLADKYVFSAQYHIGTIAPIPGPGALPSGPGYKPFSFTSLAVGTLPPDRENNYACLSLRASETVTVKLPAKMKVMRIPPGSKVASDGLQIQFGYKLEKNNVVTIHTMLVQSYPAEVCTPQFYAKVHGDLTRIAGLLKQQILYN